MLNIDLTGRVAVVTGGAGQLGRVICRTLAKAGADVAIAYRGSREMALSLEKEIRAMGRKALAVQVDVSDLASVSAMEQAIAEKLGKADIVVAAAVEQYSWTSVLQQDNSDFESQFRTCVLHNVNMAKCFVPAMQQRGWGRYIAINTECAMQCWPGQGAYVSGKRGMDGALRVLAKEVGASGVTVNQVAPGWTISDDDRANGTQVRPEYDPNVPLKHRGTDQDIANAVAFLASDMACFITGVYLPVCGGNVMPTI